jgi:hypothetical protein
MTVVLLAFILLFFIRTTKKDIVSLEDETALINEIMS